MEESSEKTAEKSTCKCGPILVGGMTIALIYGLLIVIMGIYIHNNLGSIVTNQIGDIGTFVHSDSGKNQFGQNLLPYAKTFDDDVFAGDWIHTFPTLNILVGIVTIIFACLGIYGGLNHSRISLYLTLVIIFITELILSLDWYILFDIGNVYHKEVRDELQKQLKSSYSILVEDNNVFALTMNSIMLWFECCGINDANDFKNLTYDELLPGGGHAHYSFDVSPSCCSRELFKASSSGISSYLRVRDCAVKVHTLGVVINHKGCYEVVVEGLYPHIQWTLFVVLIVNIHPEEEQRRLSRAELAKQEMEKAASQVTKFIPYSKVSSSVSKDLNRTKSTEIW